MISDAVRPVSPAARSGGIAAARAAAASKPPVRRAMNSRSIISPLTRTWSMARCRATSVPGRSLRCRRAARAMWVSRGSATISWVPWSRAFHR